LNSINLVAVGFNNHVDIECVINPVSK